MTISTIAMPLRALCLLLCTVLGPTALAAETPRPKVCLVLSGGGARGVAHIGVLKALEAQHIPIDCIAGTSMGAIVGGLYAAGYSAQELENIVRELDWAEQFDDRAPRTERSQQQKEEDFDFPWSLEMGYHDGHFSLPKGAVGGVGFERMLARATRRVSAIERFDQLPIPFRAVATDMVSGEGVVFDHGPLARVMRASMSVPGAFAPTEVDGHIYGDGGLVANLPVDAAKAMGADVIIAVNIGTPLAPREQLGNLFGVTRQMITILAGQNVKADLAKLTARDVLITPSLGELSSVDFPNALAGIETGREAAEAQQAALQKLALPAPAWQAHLAARPAPRALQGKLDFVRLEGSTRSNPEALLAGTSTNPGDDAATAPLAQDSARLLGRGDFERVDYSLLREGNKLGAVFNVEEKQWGPNFFRLGFGASTDLEGGSGFDLLIGHRLSWLNEWGGEWRNRLQLGRTRAFKTEFVQPLGVGGSVFIAPKAEVVRRTLDIFEGDERRAQWKGGVNRVGVDLGMPFGALGEARIGYAHGQYLANQLIGPANSNRVEFKEVGLTASLVLDQLDNAAFPRKGWRVSGDLFNSRTAWGAFADYSRWQAKGMAVASSGRSTWEASTELGGFLDARKVGFSDWRLGGFQRLSGYRNDQIDGNYIALGKVVYRYRLAELTPFGRATYVGGSLEIGNAWANRDAMAWDSLHHAGSVFLAADTPIGPAYVAFGMADGGHRALYLFLGRP